MARKVNSDTISSNAVGGKGWEEILERFDREEIGRS
jgi:hypothetical protein